MEAGDEVGRRREVSSPRFYASAPCACHSRLGRFAHGPTTALASNAWKPIGSPWRGNRADWQLSSPQASPHSYFTFGRPSVKYGCDEREAGLVGLGRGCVDSSSAGLDVRGATGRNGALTVTFGTPVALLGADRASRKRWVRLISGRQPYRTHPAS